MIAIVLNVVLDYFSFFAESDSDGRTSLRSTRGRQLEFDGQSKEDKQPVTRQRTQTDPVKLKTSPEPAVGKRRSATEAVDKINQVAKRLRGESYDGKTSAYRK